MSLAGGTWLNPPPSWQFQDGVLSATTGDRTDFWQHTHYGFQRDDGHFWGAPAPADFDAQISFDGEFAHLYDQAGLMLRIDAQTWIKTGVELSDGALNASVVVTRGRSDWSVVRLPGKAGPHRVRMIRTGAAVAVHWQMPDGWQLIRVADFPEGSAALGPMTCTPERAGLAVRFWDMTVGDPPNNPVHLD